MFRATAEVGRFLGAGFPGLGCGWRVASEALPDPALGGAIRLLTHTGKKEERAIPAWRLREGRHLRLPQRP